MSKIITLIAYLKMIHGKVKLLPLTLLLLISQLSTAQNGLYAEYYDGPNFERLVSSRIDKEINFYWNNTPPVPGINPYECSIRWTGRLKTSVSGEYIFSARVDDGIRVWINEKLIINNWQLNDVGRSKGKIDLVAGEFYDLKVEYFNALVEGEITLLWSLPEEKEGSWISNFFKKDEFEIVSAKNLFPPANLENRNIQPIVIATNNPPATTAKQKPKPKKKVVKKKQIPISKPSVVEQETAIVTSGPIVEVLNEATFKKYTPNNINFERTQSVILEESFEALDFLARFLNKYPQLKIKIEGHTDPAGHTEKNVKLSEKRAYAVASYLVKQDVDPKRIHAKGLGGAKPIIIPKGKKYHPENRRVEFIIYE